MPIALDDIRTYIVNLRRRADRRRRMAASVPACLRATYTSDWDGPFDGLQLDRPQLAAAGYELFPWMIDSDNPWWSRPLKLGEIGCTIAHWTCWQHAQATSTAPYVLVLEDDAILPDDFLDELLHRLYLLAGSGRRFDLLYLGRYPLDADLPVTAGVVSPGYSHCTFAYVLSRRALPVLLASRLDRAIVPVDEFLPALYVDHPRADLRARFPRRLVALALDPPLVTQRPKEDAGSDTEDSPFVDW